MKSTAVIGAVLAVSLGLTPAPALASPATAAEGCCKSFFKPVQDLFEPIVGEKVVQHWSGIVTGAFETGSAKDLVRHWEGIARNNINDLGDALKREFAVCDPNTWNPTGFELLKDIHQCREKVEPYVSALAGASTDPAVSRLTVDQAIGLIDCVQHPEMAGDVRCVW